MSARRSPCIACEGKGTHEVWAMSPSEPVRLFTCTFCHGTGKADPKPLAPLSLVARSAQYRAPYPPRSVAGALT